MAFVNERQFGAITIVDRERNMRMRVFGPVPDGPQRLELHIGKAKISFDIKDSTRCLGTPRFDVRWVILRAYMPPEFQGKEREVVAHLTEALEAYGHYGRPEKASSVTVDFSGLRIVQPSLWDRSCSAQMIEALTVTTSSPPGARVLACAWECVQP